MRAWLALSLLLLPHSAAAGGATEVTEASRIKTRFGKKELKKATVIGYLPGFDDVEAFSTAAGSFPNIPFYYVHNRATLDNLGAVGGSSSVVAIHRPWAGSKKFKVTFRGAIKDNKKFLDWVVNEALPPASYIPKDAVAAYEASAERQRRALVKAYVASEIDDPAVTKPDDWEQPEEVPDPKAEEPSDWDADEDGPWSANIIPNPEFKGTWQGKRMSTLIGDPTDEKPEDWDQPEQIPDPKSKIPEDWNEEDDGVFEPPDIPNPAYKGNWTQAEVPAADALKAAQDKLKPIAEKFGKKTISVVQAVGDDGNGLPYDRNDYGFTASDYKDLKAIVIEEPKFSTMKSANIWLKYKSPADGDLLEWVGEWAAKKLTDMDKAKRQEKRAEREKAKVKKDEL